MLTTSLLSIILQSIGVGTLLGSLYFRTFFKDKMVISLTLSIIGSVVLLIYSILTFQIIVSILNIVTIVMSIKGVITWKN